MGKFIIILITLIPSLSWASSCCGAGQNQSQVILDQQRFLFRITGSQSRALGRVFNSEEFYTWSSSKELERLNWNLSTAYSLDTKNQISFATSFFQARYGDIYGSQDSDEIGDTTLLYSRQLMSGSLSQFVSLGLLLPTGRSIYDGFEGDEGLNISGFGRSGGILGWTVQKLKFPFSILSQFQYTYLLAKTTNQYVVEQADLLSWSLLFGYSFSHSMSFGIRFEWSYLPGYRVNGEKKDVFRRTGVDFILTSLLNEKSSVSIFYSDQSLLGSPRNALLERNLGLNYSYSIY